MKHLLLYFYITSFLIFSNCYISNDNIAISTVLEFLQKKDKNTLVLITEAMVLQGGIPKLIQYMVIF